MADENRSVVITAEIRYPFDEDLAHTYDGMDDAARKRAGEQIALLAEIGLAQAYPGATITTKTEFKAVGDDE